MDELRLSRLYWYLLIQHALNVKNPRQDRARNRPQTAAKPIPATMQ